MERRPPTQPCVNRVPKTMRNREGDYKNSEKNENCKTQSARYEGAYLQSLIQLWRSRLCRSAGRSRSLKANRDDDSDIPQLFDASSEPGSRPRSIIHIAKGGQFDDGKKERPFALKGDRPFTNCTVLEESAVAD